MRHLLLVPAALAAVGLASAADLRDNVGIGLGTLIFEGHDGLVSQVSAATTNGTFGNQTFAITSGTSGAKKFDGLWANNRKAVEEFVQGNMDALAHDMAAGQGETLDALVELMNIPAAERAALGASLQANFTSIFTSPTVSHLDVVENLGRVAAKA